MNATALSLDALLCVNGKFRLQWEEAQQAWVLLYPEGMVKLNPSAGEIMNCLNGQRTVQDVVAELERKFDAQGLAPDVLEFLAQALGSGWVRHG